MRYIKYFVLFISRSFPESIILSDFPTIPITDTWFVFCEAIKIRKLLKFCFIPFHLVSFHSIPLPPQSTDFSTFPHYFFFFCHFEFITRAHVQCALVYWYTNPGKQTFCWIHYTCDAERLSLRTCLLSFAARPHRAN